MKKQIIFCTATAALLSASAVFAGGPDIIPDDYFTGLFVGGTGAFHHVSLDGTSSVIVPNAISVPSLVGPQIVIPAGTLAVNNASGSDFAGYGGVQGGIGKVFGQHWYLGVGGFGEWGDASNTATNTTTNLPVTATTITQFIGLGVNVISVASSTHSSSVTSQTTLKIKNDYGVFGKFGYVVIPGTLFYGKVGIEWADLQVSNTSTASATIDTNNQIVISPAEGGTPTTVANISTHTAATLTGNSSNEDNKTALLLGAGVEQFVYGDMVSINVEYDYANFGSVTTSANMLANVVSTVTDNLAGTTTTLINQKGIATTATTQASANAKVSTFLAGLNFYFGHNWF